MNEYIDTASGMQNYPLAVDRKRLVQSNGIGRSRATAPSPLWTLSGKEGGRAAWTKIGERPVFVQGEEIWCNRRSFPDMSDDEDCVENSSNETSTSESPSMAAPLPAGLERSICILYYDLSCTKAFAAAPHNNYLGIDSGDKESHRHQNFIQVTSQPMPVPAVSSDPCGNGLAKVDSHIELPRSPFGDNPISLDRSPAPRLSRTRRTKATTRHPPSILHTSCKAVDSTAGTA